MPQGESYGEKLLRFWAPNGWAVLWLLFGLAPLFFFETFVHEGLHWVTAEADGADATLIPFAHFNERFGRNINGAVLDTSGFVATPQIVCLLFMVGLIAVFILTSPPWRWLRTFLTWWYLGLILDLLFNTGSGLFGIFRPGTDWLKFANESGEGVAIFLSWLIVLVILSQLGWIAISKWHLNRPLGIGFFEYRGLAIFFGFISLIAIIVSLAIEHEDVTKNSWFWAVWTFQLVSLGWYVTYIIWVTRRFNASR